MFNRRAGAFSRCARFGARSASCGSVGGGFCCRWSSDRCRCWFRSRSSIFTLITLKRSKRFIRFAVTGSLRNISKFGVDTKTVNTFCVVWCACELNVECILWNAVSCRVFLVSISMICLSVYVALLVQFSSSSQLTSRAGVGGLRVIEARSSSARGGARSGS